MSVKGATTFGIFCGRALLAASFGLAVGSSVANAQTCTETVFAKVVALDQAFYVNRFGALQAGGMIFALERDVVSTDSGKTLRPGKVTLRSDKRPRPLTLRVNKGQCIEIQFHNLLSDQPTFSQPAGFPPDQQLLGPAKDPTLAQPSTRFAGVHVAGLEWVSSSSDDGSFVGANDVADNETVKLGGLVPPNGRITTRLYAAEEGAFLLTSGGATVGRSLDYGGQLSQGMFGSVIVEPPGAEYYRSQVTRQDLDAATTGTTKLGQPIINYDKLSMLAKRGDKRWELIASDLTAIITGPSAGPFPSRDATYSDRNQTYPEPLQPYREFAIHYHDDFMAVQAFAEFRPNNAMFQTMSGGRDLFAINYGMGGIGALIWANRLPVGPASECATCKFEEFFLSSWPNGDPAMVVDQPANKKGSKATKAFFPDDPSNVYHSYLRDHVKFRILHAGTNITHVHHQHAHQWLHSPNSGVSAYRDSQMISPGAAYTLDMVYGGGGNKNLTMGDSIFHCHFYPHFAQGMWALWRVHDVFERGTLLDAKGVPTPGYNRALPDGEIAQGTPIPGLVPLPTLAMAPIPARVEIKSVAYNADGKTVERNQAIVNEDDLKAGLQPGYPFFVPGIAGQRAPHPPMSYAQVDVAGKTEHLDGGLPRNVVVGEVGTLYEQHNRWDFSKDSDRLLAKQLEEDGTSVERAAMKIFSKRDHPSFTSGGKPATFVYNGQPSVQGAPFANPAVHYDGSPVKFCEATKPNCNDKDFESRKLIYKSADIQTDVVLNKAGWHYPQQRMSVLWEDVKPTLVGKDGKKKRPEPLFMRVNSGDVVEFWLTNLIPNYYELDDFQVRTPTDVVGQHIHLVKFDVLASDGAGNGFNYESGSLAAEEVRGLIGAINKAGGLLDPDGKNPKVLTAKSIPYFETQFDKSDPLILGAQATVELWYVDPLTDFCLADDQKEACPKPGQDRTIGTVFTHDHFGPSTHQQAGLYAGLIVEPRGSQWLTTEQKPMGGADSAGKPIVLRADGGPTSWAAVIKNGEKQNREFLLEFQDRQLTYLPVSRNQPKPYQRYQQQQPPAPPPPAAWGWADMNPVNNQSTAVGPPGGGGAPPTPQLITNTFGVGAWSLNYRNEPLDARLSPRDPTKPQASDTAFAFASEINRPRCLLNEQPSGPINPAPCANDNALSIEGDIVSGKVNWVVNGTPLPNNGSVSLKKGQVVRFSVKQGTHGLLFKSKTDAEAVFDIAHSPQASKFKADPRGPNTCGLATSYGTVPQAAGAGDNTIAELTVLADAKISGSGLDFECSQHCANMAGVFTLSGTNALSIEGDIVNNKVTWVVDGQPLADNGSVSLKKGQLVRFAVKNGKHGLLFKSKAEAEAVFDIAHSPQAGKFKDEPGLCNLAGSYGTDPQVAGAGDNTIAELTVLADAKISGSGLNFECSQHCAAMAGVFTIGSDNAAHDNAAHAEAAPAATTAAADPCAGTGADVTVEGDANGGVFWLVNGNRLAKGGSIPLKAGQLVCFAVKSNPIKHGLLFHDQKTAEAVFDIANSPQKSSFKLNPNPNNTGNTCGIKDAYGTTPQSPGLIAMLRVVKDVKLAKASFECSLHCDAMAAEFTFGDGVSLVADPDQTRWLVNEEELANNTAVVLEPGSKLRVSAKKSGETLFLRDDPAALFEGASGFSPANLCSINGFGLPLTTGDTELTVKKPTTAFLASFMSGNACQRMEGYFQPHIPVPPFEYPLKFEGAGPTDPYTPLMRAYPGETVEIRTLVGAHMAPHSFTMHGVKWLFEQNNPNSGFRSTQGMGISEYYQMRFDVPTTNAGADYLYASTSDKMGLEYGQWGLLRAYDKNHPPSDLPPLDRSPQQTAAVCPADAPVREYNVSVVTQGALPGGSLVYKRALPINGGAGQIVGDTPMIYVNDEDLVDPKADPVKVKLNPQKRVEPLILRAAAGDCIDVTVTNRIPKNFDLPSLDGSQAFGAVELFASRHVSLHAPQVGTDVLSSNGVTVGLNPPQTVSDSGKSVKLKWYAGSIGTDGSHTPVELGALGLTPADPLIQHQFGLLGALVIEPAGATWQEDENSHAQATVTSPSGTFREFVLVLQDDVVFAGFDLPDGKAFNYRTDQLPLRYDANPVNWPDPKVITAPVGIARALSDSQVGRDPETPVLAVSKGTKTRLRVVHPGGLKEQTFTLSGHPWQEEPFRNASREIGDNKASQWFGARDAFGANDQVNIVLDSAGGRNKVAGDYLYRSFIGNEFLNGLWGVMRVGEPGRDIVTIAQVSSGPKETGFIVAGVNTVNPDSGKMAADVTVKTYVRMPPQARESTLVTCKVPVKKESGEWNTQTCPDSARGKLDVSPTHPVEVVSSEKGSASVRGMIVPPSVANPPTQAAVARQLQLFQTAMQPKEIRQFQGEQTPRRKVTRPALEPEDPAGGVPPR